MSLVENKGAQVPGIPVPGHAGAAGHRGQFVSLELGRFIASLLVVFFHVDSAGYKFYGHYFAGNIFRSGHAGVEFFFVLSGFIIFFVHRKDIGKTDRGRAFMIRRIIRIIPMYWLAFFSVVAAYVLVPALLQGRVFSLQDYVTDMLLIPRQDEMVLNVAWTLRQEFVFYAIFLVSICFRGVGLLPVLIWQAAILFCTALGIHSTNPLLSAILSTYNLGFGAGIAVAWAHVSRPIMPPFPFLRAGSTLFLVTMFVEWRLGRGLPLTTLALGETVGPILYTIAAALMVMGAASMEARNGFANSSVWNSLATRYAALLGGASYLLYLTHGMVTSTAIRLFRVQLPQLPLELVFPILIVCAVAAAIAAHVLIEKPVLKLLRKTFASAS